jgi:hypothetical protein
MVVTRVKETCLPLALLAALAAALALPIGPARAAERAESIAVLAGPDDAERIDELRQAIAARLSDAAVEVRIVETARLPDCPPGPEDDDLERHLTGETLSLVWISDDGTGFCTLTPELGATARRRQIPDTGEGWPARCETAASMVFSEVEPLVSTDDEPEPTARTPRFAIAPRIGFDVPTSDLNPFLVAGLEVDLFLPLLDRRLVLALDTTYTRPSHSGKGSDPRIGGEYSHEIDVHQLKVALDAIVRFSSGNRGPVPFVGVGPVMHYLRTEQTTSITGYENIEWSLEPGFEALIGLDIPLGPGFLLFDFRYVYTDLDHRFAGDSNAGNTTTAVGYRIVI